MNVCECVISCKSGDQVIYRGVKKKMQKHFISISVRLRRKLILHPSILRSFSTISKGKWKESRKFRTIQSIFRLLQLTMGRLLVRQKCV